MSGIQVCIVNTIDLSHHTCIIKRVGWLTIVHKDCLWRSRYCQNLLKSLMTPRWRIEWPELESRTMWNSEVPRNFQNALVKTGNAQCYHASIYFPYIVNGNLPEEPLVKEDHSELNEHSESYGVTVITAKNIPLAVYSKRTKASSCRDYLNEIKCLT